MDFGLNEIKKITPNHFYLDGFFSAPTESMGLREAYGRKNLYGNVPIYINDNHIITGRLDLGVRQEIVSLNTSHCDVHTLNANLLNKFMSDDNVSAQRKSSVRDNINKIKTFDTGAARRGLATPEELLVEESGAALAQGYNGHLGMDFGYVLNKGLLSVIDDINYFAGLSERKDFYEALLITAEGIQEYINRHGEYAKLCMGREPYDDMLLSGIIKTCKNISRNPPASFLEAVQMQWFLMMLSDYDSFGRYDQYMYPFYIRDIANEAITREQAREYVKDMLRRVEDNGGILNMTIGGVTPEGEDAVNDLTYLVMEATRELGFKGPNLCLRITKDSDERLWDELAKNLKTGQALPAIYNDGVFIKMLTRAGVGQNDANNYCLAGCSQAVIPGRSNYNCDVGLYTPAKMLDLALHNGFDTRIQKQVGPYTGDVRTFTHFEQVMDAYNAQMKYCVEKGVALNNHDIATRKTFLSCVRTILMPECIEKGLSFLEGGCTYNGIQGEVVGLTNTADSLTAIKELAFDKKVMNMGELMSAIDNDFEGYESIRARLKKASKFGNGIDEADRMRYKITKDLYDELTSYPCEFGGTHWPGEVIFVYHMSEGEKIGALPDGRKAWAALADSAGPSQGNDINGVTSALNSCMRLPHNESYFTSINVNLKFPKYLWIGNHKKIMTLFKAYFGMGGCQLQVNVQDRQTMLDAMENPEAHRYLVVRIGGFSCYFTQLSREYQLEIISRTESGV